MKSHFLLILFLSLCMKSWSQNSQEIVDLTRKGKLPIDTNYFPLEKFQYIVTDKPVQDSLSAYYFSSILKEFNEPAIYCCESDSIIRMLTINSFMPSTVIKLFRRNDSLLMVSKSIKTLRFPEPYYDLSQLNNKELRRWMKIRGSGVQSKKDSLILAKTDIRNNPKSPVLSEMFILSRREWNSIFQLLSTDLYQMNTYQDHDGIFTSDGNKMTLEMNTTLGYHILDRQLDSREEIDISQLTQKINQLLKDKIESY